MTSFSRALSASCIPLSAAHHHSCPKCLPPSLPQDNSLPTTSAAPATLTTASRPPRSRNPLRRTRSAHPTRPRLHNVLARGMPRPRTRTLRPAPPPPPFPYPNRAVYNATTASARAAAMRLQSRYPRPAELGEHRQPLPQPPNATLGCVPLPHLQTSTDRKPTRVVMRRKLVRGSTTFRQATEDELEDLLQRERYREIVALDDCDVDVTPAVDRDLRPGKPGFLARRGVRRMSEIFLNRHLLMDAMHRDHLLDVADLASMDECAAVAVFLNHFRACQNDLFPIVHDKLNDPLSVDPKQGLSTLSKRKDPKRDRVVRDRRHSPHGKDSDFFQKYLSQRRAFSADDSGLMRALLRQEHLLSTHASNKKSKQTSGKHVSESAKLALSQDVKFDGRDKFNRERSRSEMVIPATAKHSRVIDDRWKRVLSNLGCSETTIGNTRKQGKAKFFPALASHSLLYSDSEPSSRRKTDSSGMESKASGLLTADEDDDDYDASAMRILTAIEPIDPSLAMDDTDTRRGTSYHMGCAQAGTMRNRRRFIPRGLRGDGELDSNAGILRKLRSFRLRG